MRDEHRAEGWFSPPFLFFLSFLKLLNICIFSIQDLDINQSRLNWHIIILHFMTGKYSYWASLVSLYRPVLIRLGFHSQFWALAGCMTLDIISELLFSRFKKVGIGSYSLELSYI